MYCNYYVRQSIPRKKHEIHNSYKLFIFRRQVYHKQILFELFRNEFRVFYGDFENNMETSWGNLQIRSLDVYNSPELH